jgi:hypothetical protein
MLLRLLFLFCLFAVSACSNGDPEAEVICLLETCGGDDDDGDDDDGDGGDNEDDDEPSTITISATDDSIGQLIGNIDDANYNPAFQIFTISAPGLDAQLNRFFTADYNGILAMRDPTETHNAYLGQGIGTRVVVYSGGLAGNVQRLAAFGRTSAAELPLTGSAEFNGDYVGFTPTRRVNGRASLDVDFAAATISGSITNRVLRLKPDNTLDAVNPLSTLDLGSATISNAGRFSGATTGGEIVNGQIVWNPATGSFAGLIGGATCNEAVGTVSVDHTDTTGGSFQETGGFLATR